MATNTFCSSELLYTSRSKSNPWKWPSTPKSNFLKVQSKIKCLWRWFWKLGGEMWELRGEMGDRRVSRVKWKEKETLWFKTSIVWAIAHAKP